MEKIAYNCRKATMLVEKQQFGQLTLSEQVELKLHLAGCSVCRIFQQQSITINKMISSLFKDNRSYEGLDNDFKRSIQDKIIKKLSK